MCWSLLQVYVESVCGMEMVDRLSSSLQSKAQNLVKNILGKEAQLCIDFTHNNNTN